MISSDITGQIESLAAQFKIAAPYRHVAMDGFFESDVVHHILGGFPDYATTANTNEFGEHGMKAVKERLSDVSPFYSKMVEYFRTDEFISTISRISGIEDIRWGGETMYGGGTHENINGAELDPHVDFNYYDETKEHRRLNLLIYLNEEWEQEWGGEFELHSNPRDPENNSIISYLPVLNRAVLMETNERSWHGFPRIALPTDRAHLSRKSLALYFYTDDRPKDEIVGGHSTFYIQRPLPSSFQAGSEITSEMYTQVTRLVNKRDDFLRLAHDNEIRKSKQFSEIENENEYLKSRIRIPTLGWAHQTCPADGYFPDGWIEEGFIAEFQADRNLKKINFYYCAPESISLPKTSTISILGNVIHIDHTSHQIESKILAVNIEQNETFTIRIDSPGTTSHSEAGINQDSRNLSLLLVKIEFEN